MCVCVCVCVCHVLTCTMLLELAGFQAIFNKAKLTNILHSLDNYVQQLDLKGIASTYQNLDQIRDGKHFGSLML